METMTNINFQNGPEFLNQFLLKTVNGLNII